MRRPATWRSGRGFLLLGATVLLAMLAMLAVPASAQTVPSTAVTVVVQASNGAPSDQAWITVVGVVAAAVLSGLAATISATKAARYGLRDALATGRSQVDAALASGEAQVRSAMAAAAAQQETIRAQLQQQGEHERVVRLQQLADHRRERYEDTILALQDALAKLAVAVGGCARDRTTSFLETGEWARPPAWDEVLDRTSADAYLLLQRLPRGTAEDPEDQTWTAVHRAVDVLHHRVIHAEPVDQPGALQTFEAGVKSAQDELGRALDRLDQQLLREIRTWRR